MTADKCRDQISRRDKNTINQKTSRKMNPRMKNIHLKPDCKVCQVSKQKLRGT